MVGRGLVLGAAAGLTAFFVATRSAAGSMYAAVSIADARAGGQARHDQMSAHPAELLPDLGAALLLGSALGVVLAVSLADGGSQQRPARAVRRGAGLALLGFVATVVIPMVKFPGHPLDHGGPALTAASDPHALFMLASLGVACLAWRIHAGLEARRWSAPRALAVSVGGAIVALAMLWMAWPAAAATETGPASAWSPEWLYALAPMTALWASLGVGAGLLTSAPWPPTGAAVLPEHGSRPSDRS